MPQNTTLRTFKAFIPSVLRFDLYGFRPESLENLSKTFNIFIIDIWLFTKEEVLLVYALYRKP